MVRLGQECLRFADWTRERVVPKAAADNQRNRRVEHRLGTVFGHQNVVAQAAQQVLGGGANEGLVIDE